MILTDNTLKLNNRSLRLTDYSVMLRQTPDFIRLNSFFLHLHPKTNKFLKMKNFFRSLTAVMAVAILIAGCKKPTANFTADKQEVETGEVVTFTNSSEDAAIYMWDFGDGTQSSQKNPTHVYDTPGSYQVTMTSAKNKMKKPADATAITIKVNAPPAPKAPTAAFTTSKTAAMPGEVITFAATDTIAEEFVWDFGDGQMSLSPNPTHVYAAGGTYTVSLTVYSWDRQHTDTKMATITIGNGSGDFTLRSKLVGKWKIATHNLTHTINNVTVPNCANIQPQPYTYSFPATSTPNIEVLSNNTIIVYDNDNNIRYTGSYNVIDATRINWVHNQQFISTGFTPIAGTIVPTYTGFGAGSQLWTATVSGSTLTLTFSAKNTNGSAYNNCVTPAQNISGVQVITETVTYTKQ